MGRHIWQSHGVYGLFLEMEKPVTSPSSAETWVNPYAYTSLFFTPGTPQTIKHLAFPRQKNMVLVRENQYFCMVLRAPGRAYGPKHPIYTLRFQDQETGPGPNRVFAQELHPAGVAGYCGISRSADGRMGRQEETSETWPL